MPVSSHSVYQSSCRSVGEARSSFQLSSSKPTKPDSFRRLHHCSLCLSISHSLLMAYLQLEVRCATSKFKCVTLVRFVASTMWKSKALQCRTLLEIPLQLLKLGHQVSVLQRKTWEATHGHDRSSQAQEMSKTKTYQTSTMQAKTNSLWSSYYRHAQKKGKLSATYAYIC